MIRLTPVPDEQVVVPADEFPAFARERWMEAKDAYADAFRAASSLHGLLHRPGQVRVAGTVTGALYEAKKLRDEADRMVVALDAIVRTGKASR